jgi:zinc/manganese transport system substrate-binding protein
MRTRFIQTGLLGSGLRAVHDAGRWRLPAGALALCVTAMLVAVPASAKIRVVASVTDLGSIASTVGGDEVEVAAICRPNSDPHHVEVLPSYMVRVSKAKLYLKVGMFLDQWADQIIDGSHNGDIKIVDCSEGISALEVPTTRPNASMGDVHPNGNPHYWLDPRNGGIVAHTIADALSRIDPAHAADFAARADAFAAQCEAETAKGREAVAALPVKEVVTYHSSWVYLAEAFGFTLAGTVEPVPGIPPTAKHLQELVTLIQQDKVPLLLYEPYFSDDAGNFLKRQTTIEVAKVSPSCDDVTAGSYLAHFDQIVAIFAGLKNIKN